MTHKFKLSDLVATILKENNVEAVFGVQGGAVVHLFDSIHRKTNIKVCYNHHEQGSSLAAVAHAKALERLGVCIVTTGPATTNALTGLLAAWQDSIPVLFISGQTRKEQTSYGLGVRQRGSQECNILEVVKPWTKERILVDENTDLGNELQRAIDIAFSGRKGPVWVDIPVNLQWSKLDYKKNIVLEKNKEKVSKYVNEIAKIQKDLLESNKPLIVFGRNNLERQQRKNLFQFASDFNIPIATTWGSATIVNNQANNVGIIGVSGHQSANLAIRAADYVLFIGCHFSSTQAGNNYKKISNSQRFVYINIDKSEMEHLFIKNKSEYYICDSRIFVNELLSLPITKNPKNSCFNWNNFINNISDDLSPVQSVSILKDKLFVSPHQFICDVYKKLESNDYVVIDGGGTALYAGFQCIPRDATFKAICSTSISAMGTGLPELVGASFDPHGNRFYCIIGDGSLMFNVQELQTIKTNCSPTMIIVINNNGYLAIRHTQSQFLESRFYGTSDTQGLEIPSIKEIAKTFGFNYIYLDKQTNYHEILEKSLNYQKGGHTILEIFANDNHKNLFTASFTKNADDTFTPNDIHLMQPFDNYDYKTIAKKNNVDLNK